MPFKAARGLDLAISAIDRAIWEEGAGPIGDEINRLLRKFSLEVDDSSTAIPAADPQTITAIRFSDDNDRPISVSDDFPTDDDRDAADRHSAVVEAVQRLVSDFSPGGRGGNQTAPIVRDVQSLGEALGVAPRTMSLGLVIPRGERLRQTLIVLENKQDDAEGLRLPDEFIRDLRVVVSAYNVLVAMDPILEARDRAQISPSLVDREIAPATAAAALSDAVAKGVADQTVPAVFAEEAAIAPLEPSTDNRSSRRLTESFRNFCRAAASQVRAGVKLAWRNKGKIVIATGVAKGAVQWIASHDALLLGLFPSGSSMHELILRIVHIATMLN